MEVGFKSKMASVPTLALPQEEVEPVWQNRPSRVLHLRPRREPDWFLHIDHSLSTKLALVRRKTPSRELILDIYQYTVYNT